MATGNACPNTHECACPNVGCDNHGKCCDCIASHRERNYFPFCVRPHPEDEHFPIWPEKVKPE